MQYSVGVKQTGFTRGASVSQYAGYGLEHANALAMHCGTWSMMVMCAI